MATLRSERAYVMRNWPAWETARKEENARQAAALADERQQKAAVRETLATELYERIRAAAVRYRSAWTMSGDCTTLTLGIPAFEIWHGWLRAPDHWGRVVERDVALGFPELRSARQRLYLMLRADGYHPDLRWGEPVELAVRKDDPTPVNEN